MSDHQEIVIVKRHGGDHDDHHGGAWKIAFADFMTAMMAFFLVMWLIAANDKTRATVARYFNPVKLVDATVRKQGLQDPKADDTTSPVGHSTDGNASKKNAQHPAQTAPETAKGREARLDNAMRTDPFAALAEIAGSKGPGEAPREVVRGSAPVIGRQGGAAFRDPFAPPPPQSPSVPDKDDDVLAITPPKPISRAIVPPPTESTSTPAPAPAPAAEAAKSQKKDEELAKQLMTSLKGPAGQEAAGPDIKVRRTSEGFLVSLTDTGNFSMFANASAVPSRRVVMLMEHVAKILATKPGGVVIRGFTDNKPYRSGHYDNWNLSVDRAQAAHYMLVRGGLSDARIAGVEGFADRGPKNGIDPASPLNRRIEILLKDGPT